MGAMVEELEASTLQANKETQKQTTMLGTSQVEARQLARQLEESRRCLKEGASAMADGNGARARAEEAEERARIAEEKLRIANEEKAKAEAAATFLEERVEDERAKFDGENAIRVALEGDLARVNAAAMMQLQRSQQAKEAGGGGEGVLAFEKGVEIISGAIDKNLALAAPAAAPESAGE
jgi:hypothetical protein